MKKLTRCTESLLSRAFLPIIVYTMNIQTKNPATGEPLSSYPAMHVKKVKKILEQGQASFLGWKETSLDVRARLMKEAARLLQTRSRESAELMAGSGCVLKHASNVTGCALTIEKIFIDAGFPDHLFSTLIIPSSDVEQFIAHPLIRGVTLWGSDPYIILHDADLESAAQTCAESRLLNSGQSCISAKRFIVEVSVLKKFEALLTEKMGMSNMGDPLSEETEIGPLARHDLREELHEQVKKSMHLGARCLLGGEIPEGKGFFYPPTVLSGVRRGMPVLE